ncbi:PEGA domain-containing protein [Deinococcus sp. HMF7620]|uniref:PEGA domain-containing protein n=1 Tax=Deinococcus arboris TaxID=2682977 RepID=A0A7C9LQN0_9DEIO|nr:PEGA domain-containing protein [Deinococcus arboris]MVN86701.1 PEGA domain-containing protein [Deinococcus arboris]
MKRLAVFLALGGLLSSCVPAPLRANPDAGLRLSAALDTPPLRPITGEPNLYRVPGPGGLTVQTDRAAQVTAIVVPPSGGAALSETVRTVPGQATRLPLPPAQGFTQVFTVASLVPLDLQGARGARSVNEVARAVEQATSAAPRSAYTVATTVYRAERLGSLRVTTNVPGTQLRVGGRLAGTAPLDLNDLPPGSLEVSAAREGYRPVTQRVIITGDRTTQVDLTLRPLAGTLRVQSAVAAEVSVERQVVGAALPGQPLDLSVRPGVLAVNVTPRDRALSAQALLVRVSDAQVSLVECALTAGTYTCTVR